MIIVNGEKMDWSAGMTVQQLLHACNYVWPLIAVKVNERLVRKPEYASYLLADGDEINVVHMISGG